MNEDSVKSKRKKPLITAPSAQSRFAAVTRRPGATASPENTEAVPPFQLTTLTAPAPVRVSSSFC